MALEYFLYTTLYNNTLVDRSDTTFVPLPPNTGQILIDFLIPNTQPLYYYREDSSTIVLNDEATIEAYLEGTAPPPQSDDDVIQSQFTGYTATTDASIDYLSGETANKVVWKNVWTGGTYQENEMVRSDTWTMIANKETSDVAPPQAVGPEGYLYYPSVPSGTSTNAKQIVFGMQYTSPVPFWLNGYRVYVTAGNYYELIYVKDPEGANEAVFINAFTADVTGWREFTLQPRPFASGNTNQLLAIVHEPDPTPVTINANYDYQKPNNWVAPTSGQAIHANKNAGIISFNDLDDGGGDRSALLLGLDAGDYITVGATRWAVQTVTNEGNYIDVAVAPARQAIVSGVQEFGFETVVASTLSYGKDPNYWSGSTAVKGVFGVDIGWDDAVTDDSQYGIDILVQNAYISPDWDFVTNQGSNAGSSSSSSAIWGYIGGDINDQPDLQTQFDTKVDLSGDSMTGSLHTSGNLTAVGAVTGSSVSASVLITTPVLNASTSICAPQITGSTCVTSPIICGTTSVLSPVLNGSVCVTSPTVCAGTCLCSVGTSYFNGGVTAASFLNVSGVTTFNDHICWVNPTTGGTLNDYGVKWDPISKQLRTIATTGSSANVYCYASSAVTQNNATDVNADYINKTWSLSEGYYESEFNAIFGNTSANRCATVCFLVNGVVVGSCNLMKTNDGTVRTTAYVTQNGNLSGGTHTVQIVFRAIGGGIAQTHYGAARIQKIGETV